MSNVYNVCRLPSLIKLGYDGENLWRPNHFDCGTWFRKAPGGVVMLWIWPTGGAKHPVSVTVEDDIVTWTPQDMDITAGSGKLQLVYQVDERTGMSAVSYYRVSESIPGGEDGETPSWALDMTQKFADAVSHYPRIVDGYWWVWDVESGEWVNTNVKASGAEIDPADIAVAVEDYMDDHPVEVTETDPTVPAWAKAQTKPTYTAQEVGALPADTPIPTVPTNVSAFTNDADYQTAQDVQDAIIDSRFDDLDYIEADGQSYFDTGILPSADIEIEVTFRHKTAESVLLAPRQFVFGSYAKNGSTVIDRCQFMNGGNSPLSQGSTNSGLCGWNGAWSSVEQAPLPTSAFVTVTANVSGFRKGAANPFYVPTPGTFDANALSIYLFGCHVPSGDTLYLANGVQIASAVIRKSGVVIASYEPKQDKVTGAKGYVNMVDGSFTPMTSTASVVVTSVNGKTGTVVLNASDVGALPDSTPIPAKTSDLTNDSGFQTSVQVQAAINEAAELPSGGSAGDFLRKTASGVAWETIPRAEDHAFGGSSS